ncbi:SMI1/KNR4 family protein [Mangrovibacter sp. SLW1]
MVGKLPKSYHDFLFYFGSNVTFDGMVSFKSIEPSSWADSNGFDSIEYFYGLNETHDGYSIFDAIDVVKDDFNMKLIPIAFSSGGNQICVSTEMKKGAIWFWDHEVDPVFEKGEVISGVTLVSHNFNDFIKKLKVDNDTSPSKAIGGYLDF